MIFGRLLLITGSFEASRFFYLILFWRFILLSSMTSSTCSKVKHFFPKTTYPPICFSIITPFLLKKGSTDSKDFVKGVCLVGCIFLF